MSAEAPIGLTLMEKLLGMLLIVVGALWFYATYTNMTSVPVSTLFLGVAVGLIVLGIVLVIAKLE
jgi:hypothetical protein